MNNHDDERELTPYEREQEARECHADFLRDELRDRQMEQEREERLAKAAERPTPITDDLRNLVRALYKEDYISGDTMGELLAESARVEGLERQLAEAREELNEWKTLQTWGGTPEIVNAFIKGQQSRIHAAQDIEEHLAAERALADRLAVSMQQLMFNSLRYRMEPSDLSYEAAEIDITAWKEARKQQ